MKTKTLREKLKEFNENNSLVNRAIFKKRMGDLEKAFNNGTLKHALIAGGALGAGLVYAGLTNNNETVSSLGYGILLMDSIYAIGLYLPLYLNKQKNKNDKS